VPIVSEPAPTPQEAQAALAEASTQAARVRRADQQFRWFLLGIAAAYVGGSAIISTSPRPGGSAVAWTALLVFLTGFVIAFIALGLRIRAYSRKGFISFLGAFAVFMIWDTIVNGVSLGSRFWSPLEPSYHLVISESVGVIPLIIAAWLIGRR
jgi:cell division protein FtsW (lipid II flippase)